MAFKDLAKKIKRLDTSYEKFTTGRRERQITATKKEVELLKERAKAAKLQAEISRARGPPRGMAGGSEFFGPSTFGFSEQPKRKKGMNGGMF